MQRAFLASDASYNGVFYTAVRTTGIFCLPACPTYRLTLDERSSPRGRITLMRAVESGRLPVDDPTVREQSSYCLGCRACEPVCPAGVQYGALLEQWRDLTWSGTRPSSIARISVMRPRGLERSSSVNA